MLQKSSNYYNENNWQWKYISFWCDDIQVAYYIMKLHEGE